MSKFILAVLLFIGCTSVSLFGQCTLTLNPITKVWDCTGSSGGGGGDATIDNVQKGTYIYCADAGSTDAYACNMSPALSTYTTGANYLFKANTANTGAASLNLNSLGAKTIKKASGGITTDLSDNDIRVGQFVLVSYDGTNFQMQSTLGNSGGTGDVTGPGSAVSGNIATFNGTGGKTIQDGGKALPSGTIVGTSDSQTLTNKTLTTPTIGDLTNATHTHTNNAGGGTLGASAIASGTVATARLGSGTADSSTFLRGDQTWSVPAGGGDVSGPGSAVADNLASFNGGTGKIIKDSGKAVPTGSIVGTTDSQTLSNKTLTTPTIGDFTNATHSHTNAAGGGTLSASAIASGTLSASRGGAGSSNGILKADGAGNVSAATAGTDYTTPSSTETQTNKTLISNTNSIGPDALKNYCADAGSNDTYACNMSPAITGYTTGAQYYFKANTANTGAATVNFNSLGAKTIKKVVGGVTTDLSDNDILAGQFVSLIYDGTNMQMQSMLANGVTIVAGSGISVSGSTVSADTAVMLSNATNQAGTRTKCATSTSTSAPVCSLTPTLTAYNDGAILLMSPHANFSANATLNIDSLGARKLYKMSSGSAAQIGASDIVSTGKYLILYSSALDSSTGGFFVVPLESGTSGALTRSGPYFYDGTNYYLNNLTQAYLPSLLSFSWVKQGTAAVAGSTYETMTITQGSNNVHSRVATLSTSTVEGWFTAALSANDSNGTKPCGLVLRESSTNKLLLAGLYNQNGGPPAFYSGRYTSDGDTWSATVFEVEAPYSAALYGIKMVLTSTTWDVYVGTASMDGSGNTNWAWIASFTQTTPFTTAANQFGYGGENPSPTGKSSYCTALSLRAY